MGHGQMCQEISMVTCVGYVLVLVTR